MLFSTGNDIRRCSEIVRKELNKKGIVVEKVILKKITKDVMNISQAKGGDYSSEIIRRFAEALIL